MFCCIVNDVDLCFGIVLLFLCLCLWCFAWFRLFGVLGLGVVNGGLFVWLCLVCGL